MCDMDPEDERDPVVDAILERTVPGYLDRPAFCHHRCDCDCHRDRGVVHCAPCCTGCGHGHSQVKEVFLETHLKACHHITKT